MHTHIHTHSLSPLHTHTFIYISTLTHTHSHTHAHSHIQPHTQPRTYTQTRTLTHRYNLARAIFIFLLSASLCRVRLGLGFGPRLGRSITAIALILSLLAPTHTASLCARCETAEVMALKRYYGTLQVDGERFSIPPFICKLSCSVNCYVATIFFFSLFSFVFLL